MSIIQKLNDAWLNDGDPDAIAAKIADPFCKWRLNATLTLEEYRANSYKKIALLSKYSFEAPERAETLHCLGIDDGPSRDTPAWVSYEGLFAWAFYRFADGDWFAKEYYFRSLDSYRENPHEQAPHPSDLRT